MGKWQGGEEELNARLREVTEDLRKLRRDLITAIKREPAPRKLVPHLPVDGNDPDPDPEDR